MRGFDQVVAGSIVLCIALWSACGKPKDADAGNENGSAQNRAFVQLAGNNALVEVDLDTGNRSIISDAGRGRGPVFNTEQSLAYDRANEVFYVLDTGDDALFVVDGRGGDRVYLSK